MRRWARITWTWVAQARWRPWLADNEWQVGEGPCCKPPPISRCTLLKLTSTLTFPRLGNFQNSIVLLVSESGIMPMFASHVGAARRKVGGILPSEGVLLTGSVLDPRLAERGEGAAQRRSRAPAPAPAPSVVLEAGRCKRGRRDAGGAGRRGSCAPSPPPTAGGAEAAHLEVPPL